VSEASAERADRFRQNEVLRAFAEGLPGPFGFRCECADPRCSDLVLVEAADVYAVRANPRRLVVAPEHQTGEERVVRELERYYIVELEEGGTG
jgi:hypothetical protein